MRKTLILLLGFLIPMPAYGSGVTINEVLFNPAGSDTGLESIELYNPDDSSRDLSGWQLYPDGVGYFYFPEHFILDSKKTAVIHLRSSGENTSSDLYFPGASGNMGNTSGSVALFSGEPRGKDTIKSFMQWGKAGETWESDAEKAGLWTKGEFINTTDLAEDSSVGLINDGIGAGKAAWKTFSPHTIGFLNNDIQQAPAAVGDASNQTSSSSFSQPAYVVPLSAIQIPRIKTYAGEDKNNVAGGVVGFAGSAWGLKDEPLINARFWWNFGDGETWEGRIVEHIFKTPGRYTVGLHVSSGEYLASDYLVANIAPNQVLIKSVLRGEEGYISLSNPSSLEIDIGGWILEDGGRKRFFLPVKTIIAGKSDISLMNRTTGLVLQGEKYPVKLLQIDSSQVYEFKDTVKISAEESPVVVAITPGQNAQNKNSQEDGGKKDEIVNIADIKETAPPVSIAGNKETNNLATMAGSENIDNFFSRQSFIIGAVVLSLISALCFIFLKRAPNV